MGLLLNETGFPLPVGALKEEVYSLLHFADKPSVLISGFPYREEAGVVSGCETTVTQCIHVPSQLRKAGLPRMGVKNSWFASECVFTLRHREQALAATSNKMGISGCLLSVKITAALLSCCFTSYLSI